MVITIHNEPNQKEYDSYAAGMLHAVKAILRQQGRHKDAEEVKIQYDETLGVDYIEWEE